MPKTTPTDAVDVIRQVITSVWSHSGQQRLERLRGCQRESARLTRSPHGCLGGTATQRGHIDGFWLHPIAVHCPVLLVLSLCTQ